MRKVLSKQSDFHNEKPLLQIIIERAYFLPKFHCELNPIGMYWGWMIDEAQSKSGLRKSAERCDFPGKIAITA